MKRQLVQYLMQSLCSEDELRPVFSMPFISGEYVAATDGYILLLLPKCEMTIPDCINNWNKPNVSSIIDTSKTCGCALKIGDLIRALPGKEKAISLCGISLHKERVQKLVNTALLLGLAEMLVHSDTPNSVVLTARFANRPMYIKMMGTSLPAFEIKTSEYRHRLPDCDINQGFPVYSVMLQKDEQKKKERETRDFKVFEITMVKCAHICVKADNWNDARKIAEKSINDSDFSDSNPECDSYSESSVYSTDFETYWDEDGEHDVCDENEDSDEDQEE